jgi:threonine aldolase
MINSGLINFASENFAGVHPEIMQALLNANTGNERSYGNDHYTADAVQLFKKHFGEEIDVYFTFSGTGANNFGLGCVTEKFQSIFCSDVAHLYVDESTAPETFCGCRLYPLNSKHGKISADALKSAGKRKDDIHHPHSRVISITQPTEYGTAYTLSELKSIKEVCVENDWLLHVDGARFFNAAAHLDVSLKTLSRDAGIDVLTLGGTKAGMMFGEAVIFFSTTSTSSKRFHLKRSMQLASKQRFIAAQFTALLENDLWHRIAVLTNNLAKKFEQAVAEISAIKIQHPVESNSVFFTISSSLFSKMKQHANFYYWKEWENEARVMFSFNNTEGEIETFLRLLRQYQGEQ